MGPGLFSPEDVSIMDDSPYVVPSFNGAGLIQPGGPLAFLVLAGTRFKGAVSSGPLNRGWTGVTAEECGDTSAFWQVGYENRAGPGVFPALSSSKWERAGEVVSRQFSVVSEEEADRNVCSTEAGAGQNGMNSVLRLRGRTE